MSRWTRRSESKVFRVTKEFPHLTSGSFQTSQTTMDRIIEVRYRINLDGLTAEAAPQNVQIASAFKGWS